MQSLFTSRSLALILCMLFCISVVFSYTPTWEVKYGSKITSGGFQPNMDYAKRVVITAGAVFVAGLIALILYLFGMLGRCCCYCCRCYPKVPADAYDQVAQDYSDVPTDVDHTKDLHYYPWNSSRRMNLFFFILICLTALAVDQVMMAARSDVSHGVTTIFDTWNGFTDLADDLNSDCWNIVKYADDLANEYSAAESSCPGSYAYSSTINNDIQSFTDAVNSINGKLNITNSISLDKYKQEFVYYGEDIAMIGLWGLAVVAILLTLIFALCRSKCGMMSSLWFVGLVYLIFLVLGIVWIIFVMVLGDLCTDPTGYLLDNIGRISKTAEDYIGYYLTCEGSTPIQTNLAKATGYINQFNDTITTSLGYCPGDPNLLAMVQTVKDMNNTMASVYYDTGCHPIMDLYHQAVETGVCTQFYSGMFLVWGSQLCTSFFLFWILVVGSITYQYFLPIETLIVAQPNPNPTTTNATHANIEMAPVVDASAPSRPQTLTQRPSDMRNSEFLQYDPEADEHHDDAHTPPPVHPGPTNSSRPTSNIPYYYQPPAEYDQHPTKV